MDPAKTIIVPSEGLTCPVCCNCYNLGENKPISLSCCGNTICSSCLKKVRTCVFCRDFLSYRLNYPKNILICSLLEFQAKAKTNLCQTHNKPLEIFCKLHEQLLCLSCAFEGDHLSHNDEIIQLSEVKAKAKRTKDCLEKIKKKMAESKKKIDAFSQEKRNTLKRVIDEAFDEHIEPLLALKKKMHLEADLAVFVQNGKYGYENVEEKQEGAEKWKEETENLVNEWDLSLSGKTASKLLVNDLEIVEKELYKIGEETLGIENTIDQNSNKFLEKMQSKLQTPKLKENSKEIWEIANQIEFPKNPRIHLEILARYLEEHGLQVEVNKNQEKLILKSRNQQKLSTIKNEDKSFSCILEELRVEFNNLQISHFNLFCRTIRLIGCLKVFSLEISNISDQDLLFLGKSIQASPSIEQFMIDFCLVANSFENTLAIFWARLTHLPSLKKLVMQIHLQNGTGDLTPLYKVPELSNLSKLEEVELSFRSLGRISQRGVGFILQSLQTAINIKKFSITISDWTNIETKTCEELSRLCESLKGLEELVIQFTESFHIENMNIKVAINSLGISTLSSEKNYNLHISCSHFHYLISTAPIFRYLFHSSIAKQIKELTIDLLTYDGDTEESLIKKVDEYCQLFQLRKLVLKLNDYWFHENRLQFIIDYLSQFISNGDVTIQKSRKNQNSIFQARTVSLCFQKQP